jgi:hypothetical protein
MNMAITVKGGMVSLDGNEKVKAAVDQIDFPTANRVNGQVPGGAVGVLALTNVPDHQNFVKDNQLKYSDSNNNNNATLTVNSVVGPTKYNVTKN